jgi:PAS domain S-box-containing protein
LTLTILPAAVASRCPPGPEPSLPDIEACEAMADTADLDAYRRSGIRAVQSTPLISRSGQLLGMISTHWRNPHQPTEFSLRPFDVLARQAADLIERVQVESMLRESEQRSRWLASIVESSDDAIVSTSLDGAITSWNRGAERIFGYVAEEVVGKSITILLPPDRRDEEPAILNRIRFGDRVDHYETVRQRKDGSLIDISLTVSPIKNRSGEIIGASKISRETLPSASGATHKLPSSPARPSTGLRTCWLTCWRRSIFRAPIRSMASSV